MKNKKIQYLIYLVILHGACIFLTISKFVFPKWGGWLVGTKFLHAPFSVYIAMIIAVFPMLPALPYFFQHDFSKASAKKRWTLAAILVGNALLILTYTAVISKIMS